MKRAIPLAALLLAAACATARTAADTSDPDQPPTSEPAAAPASMNGVAVTVPPYDRVHVNWKHRLDVPYIYVEHRGDYRHIGRAIRNLRERAELAGIVERGELFCLFYDDPGWSDVDELRARACLPVEGRVGEGYDLGYDVLPSETVVYAVVSGKPLEVPQTYPRLFEYLARRNWEPRMPIREVYLNVDANGRPDGLLTEVQIPWATAGSSAPDGHPTAAVAPAN